MIQNLSIFNKKILSYEAREFFQFLIVTRRTYPDLCLSLDELAKLYKKSRRMIAYYMKQLKATNLVKTQKNGLGGSNMHFLNQRFAGKFISTKLISCGKPVDKNSKNFDDIRKSAVKNTSTLLIYNINNNNIAVRSEGAETSQKKRDSSQCFLSKKQKEEWLRFFHSLNPSLRPSVQNEVLFEWIKFKLARDLEKGFSFRHAVNRLKKARSAQFGAPIGFVPGECRSLHLAADIYDLRIVNNGFIPDNETEQQNLIEERIEEQKSNGSIFMSIEPFDFNELIRLL